MEAHPMKIFLVLLLLLVVVVIICVAGALAKSNNKSQARREKEQARIRSETERSQRLHARFQQLEQQATEARHRLDIESDESIARLRQDVLIQRRAESHEVGNTLWRQFNEARKNFDELERTITALKAERRSLARHRDSSSGSKRDKYIQDQQFLQPSIDSLYGSFEEVGKLMNICHDLLEERNAQTRMITQYLSDNYPNWRNSAPKLRSASGHKALPNKRKKHTH